MTGLVVVLAVAMALALTVRRDRLRRRLAALGPPDDGATRWRLAHERDALAGLAIGFALRGVAGAWMGLAIGIAWAEIRQRREVSRRLERIERQVPELVRSLVASLRVGGDVGGAFANAADELPEPIATPMRAVGRRLAAGASLDDALETLRAEVPADGIERLVDAIRIGLVVEAMKNIPAEDPPEDGSNRDADPSDGRRRRRVAAQREHPSEPSSAVRGNHRRTTRWTQ